MKKKYLAILLACLSLFSLTMLSGCVDDSLNTLPQIDSDKDTMITETFEQTPDNVSPKDAVYAAIGCLYNMSSYKNVSTGTSIASVSGLFNYKQQTDCFTVKNGDEYFSESNSTSAFVSVKHEAFKKGNYVAHRVNGGEIINAEASSYKDVYGVTPDKILSGHVFNDETIVSAQLDSVENDEYNFTIVLDKDKGNILLFKQMKEFGGLKGYPVFTDNTVIRLTISKDYIPLKYSYTSKYEVNVSLLGSMPCVENNEVVFSEFNSSLEIPDGEKFSAALESVPSVIEPEEKEEDVDPTRQKVIGALLKSDFNGGISLMGSLKFGSIELPLKINASVDVDSIVNNAELDLSSAIKVRISSVAYDKDFSFTYCNGKGYIDLFGKKYVDLLALDSFETGGITDLFKTDFSALFKITELDNVYTVRLNNFVIETSIKSALKDMGLAGDKVNEYFDLSFGLYIPNDRVGEIYFNLTTDTVDLGGEFNLSDERFVEPNDEDYSVSPQEIKKGISADVTLADFGAVVDAYVCYDVANFNFKQALKAELNISIDDSIKTLISLAEKFTDDIPADISAILKSDKMSFLVENGRLLFVAKTENNVVYASEVEISLNALSGFGKEPRVLNDDQNAFNISDYVEISYSNGVLNVNATEKLVGIIVELWDEIPELIIEAVGQSFGSMLAAYVGKPLASIGLTVDFNANFFNVFVDVYDVNTANGNVYIAGRDYGKTTIIEVIASPVSIGDYLFEQDFEKIADDVKAAKPVYDLINEISSVQIGEQYKERVNEVKALYFDLTEEQRLLVYGVDGESYFDNLIKESDNLSGKVDSFVKGVKSMPVSILNSYYNAFSEEQIKYLNEVYPSEHETYLTRRADKEVESVASVDNFISTVKVYTKEELCELPTNDLLSLFKQYASQYKTVSSLCRKSLEKLDLSVFDEQISLIVGVYCDKIGELALNYKYNAKNCYEKSCVELLAYYNETVDFYKTYASSFESEKIWGLVNKVNKSLAVDCYFVEYYLTKSGCGFRKYAAIALEKEIEILISQNYEEYDFVALKEKFDLFDSLLEKTDKNAVLNADKYSEFKSDVKSSLATALKEELPVITEKLKAINDGTTSDDDIVAVKAEIERYRIEIDMLSTESKIKLTIEISKFNTQASKFDKNYA